MSYTGRLRRLSPFSRTWAMRVELEFKAYSGRGATQVSRGLIMYYFFIIFNISLDMFILCLK